MQKYTIVGYYEDTGQVFVDWEEGTDEWDALRRTHTWLKGQTLAVIAVFPGHLEVLPVTESVCSLANLATTENES